MIPLRNSPPRSAAQRAALRRSAPHRNDILFIFSSPRRSAARRSAMPRISTRRHATRRHFVNLHRHAIHFLATLRHSTLRISPLRNAPKGTPMKICTAHLRSATPYSASREHGTPKLEKETHDVYDLRTWRERLHVDGDNRVFIPAMAFKQAVDKAASMLGIQVPGRGKATYTKHFLAGCVVESDVVLTRDGKPVLKDDAQLQRIFANADGKRGSGKRVFRHYPVIPQWEGQARFVLLDEQITKEVFERHLRESGQYVGVGRWRAEVGGMNGRFAVEKFAWE
jgi:hypothetical protein